MEGSGKPLPVAEEAEDERGGRERPLPRREAGVSEDWGGSLAPEVPLKSMTKRKMRWTMKKLMESENQTSVRCTRS